MTEKNKNLDSRGRRKKRDYRRWANKYLKDPTKHLPLILGVGGSGVGKSSYCYDCQNYISRSKITGKIHECKECGGTSVELRPKFPSLWNILYYKFKQFDYNRKKYK
jgi:hypothetical protein